MSLSLPSKIIINCKSWYKMLLPPSIMGACCNVLVAFKEFVVDQIVFARLWACIAGNVGQIATGVNSSAASGWAIPGDDVVELSCEGYLELVGSSLALPDDCSELPSNKCRIT
jgi:hypothetical protein